MIAMRLSNPDLSQWQLPLRSSAATELEGERTPEPASEPFRPLDPDIISSAIPAFFIGRNKDGFWVARDARGRIGGIFLSENSAVAFARENSQPGGCATIFPSNRFELDLENDGNPMIRYLEPLIRLSSMVRRRIAALLGLEAPGAKEF